MPPNSDIAKQVKGFMDPEEAQALYEFALQAAARGPCLEIGGYCGKSALFLGAACQEQGGILFSVDHHRGSEEQQPGEEYFDPELLDAETGRIDSLPHFRKTLETAGLEETVVPLVSSSCVAARAWATPLSLVFIDGGHSFEAAFTDYNGWACHLIPGGFLLIHDIFPDPSQGGQAPYQVWNLAIASGLFDIVNQVKSLGILQRRVCGQILKG